jgi:hypothetical protein
MAIEITEIEYTRGVRSGENPEIRRQYYVEGTDDDGIALKALQQLAVPVLGGLIRKECVIDQYHADETFLASVVWGRMQRPEKGKKLFSFDTGGERVRITQAIEQKGYAAEGKKAADHKGAIAVDKDGRAQGVDIETSAFAFTVTGSIPHGTMNRAYVRTLFEATGKVNHDPWSILTDDGVVLDFLAREAKLLRVTGSKQTEDDWELRFDFDALPSKKNFKVGDITIAEKAGWDYLWVQYEESVDEDAKPKSVVVRPKFAYVGQVFETYDYSRLGLSLSLVS